MALSKDKKTEVVDEISALLASSKMTVAAAYPGTTVKAIQALRKEAKQNGTVVRVVKNRLLITALKQTEGLKDVDTSALKGQLLYAFNDQDEVAPAQVLNTFANQNPTSQVAGASRAEGTFLGAEDVKALAGLPSRNELIGQVVATLQSPLDGVMNGLSGNLHALLDGVSEKAAV